ncbi:MAG: hypothetical protein O2820_11045 [Planctomycetota bacterium]|nr:hypothetical protein [Planctomycetota bacterium]MDA1249745.1 hypothetical protein [Planctomycetota bacterium]
MTDSLFKTVSWHLDYYGDFLSTWWSHIGFWDYIGIMVFCLWLGWLLLRGPVPGRC